METRQGDGGVQLQISDIFATPGRAHKATGESLALRRTSGRSMENSIPAPDFLNYNRVPTNA